ncbi:hypothetical protein GCM10023194_81060 [Planotetraspora phitsanulokensis]|uniref:Uncharacterized protein n=2 Tax=Planotetraspora phitsanulokensis TaxID=575192 RepID=A0A8J3UQS3_9ACTN|nr:hypothetical protein Pph01_79480 [Planotetraspora phitsanulokensis]
MTEQQQAPDWAQVEEALKAGAASLGKALERFRLTLAAQGALGLAYRGDLESLGPALARMTPEQLVEVSAAAALLGSSCDEELARRRQTT